MNETDAPGPRIDAAKAAAQSLVDALPDDARIALMTYGTGTGSSEAEQAAGCRDVKTLIALGRLDRAAIRAQISGLHASGYTPISLALRTAASLLPTDSSPQAIVLVSDGEDTCGSPPCDAAKEIKASHPGLTISTVGFKTAGEASAQLSCIATVTGGVFVQAANASQLAARLTAIQNVTEAKRSLTSSGIEDIALGAQLAEIRKAHLDFPDASSSGSVTVVYRDCDFRFVDGVLDSISPHDGGHTIDGVAPGTPLSRVAELYGKPVKNEVNNDGSHRVVYSADPNTDAGYGITVDQYAEAADGTISGLVKTIVLCRCAPKGSPSQGDGPAIEVLKPVEAQGNTEPGWLKDSSRRDSPIDCSDGTPSPYDVTQGVRYCGITADSGDACWPTANGAYVLCLVDPFSKTLYLISATGLSTPRKPLTTDPTPFALVLDDKTKCRARNGGSWSSPKEQPDWVGYYSCQAPGFTAVWGPRDSGITKGPDGWTVYVGPADGHLVQHKVTTAYFVGIA